MVSISIPNSLPFSICTADAWGRFYCFSADEAIQGWRYTGCDGWVDMARVDVSYVEKYIGFWGGENIKVHQSMYVGVDTSLNCVYIGGDGIPCAKFCRLSPVAVANSFRDAVDAANNLAWDITNYIKDHTGHPTSGTGTKLFVALLAVVIVLIAIIIPPTGLPG